MRQELSGHTYYYHFLPSNCHPFSLFSSTSYSTHDMPLTSAAAMVGPLGGAGERTVIFSPPTASGCTCFLSLNPLPFAPSATLGPNFSTIYRGQFLSKTHLKYRSPKLRLVAGAADSTQPSSIATGGADKAVVPDDEFSVTKVSFGTIGLSLGVTLLSYGFGGYFNILPGSEWSALMLTYGFPLAIIGMALKYAELKPVPCLTYSDALALRENCATPILKQVRSDVIRYRYGDEQHLEEALKRIFQYGQGGGIPRRSAPILQSIREEVTEDKRYSLVLVFEAKALKLSDFQQRQAKFTSFFGPGITAEIEEGGKDLYEVKLISNTTL